MKVMYSRNEIKSSKDLTREQRDASASCTLHQSFIRNGFRRRLAWRSVSAGLMRCWSQIWSISQKLKPANQDVIGWFLPHVLSQEITLTDLWPISTGSHISHHAFYTFSVGFHWCFMLRAVPFLRLVFVFAETASSLSSVMSRWKLCVFTFMKSSFDWSSSASVRLLCWAGSVFMLKTFYLTLQPSTASSTAAPVTSHWDL